MKNSKLILSLDPSGNFSEGKGTTGWCLFNKTKMEIVETGSISAKDYQSSLDYWDAHIKLLKDTICFTETNEATLEVVMEDYLLYRDKAENQINSRLETPKLIGIIQYVLWKTYGIKVSFQLASQVKPRWTNDILLHKGYIGKSYSFYIAPNKKRLNRHVLDSIRHAVHYATFHKENKNE